MISSSQNFVLGKDEDITKYLIVLVCQFCIWSISYGNVTHVFSSREQIDAQVAKQLAEKMEREELEKRQALEEGDQEIALKLQVSTMHS